MTLTGNPSTKPPAFILPGAADRTTVIGATGTGKTILGAWLLSRQRFDKRPWVVVDFKGEDLWHDVGTPPMQRLKLSQIPKHKGLYLLPVNPGQEDEFEEWLWKVWGKENIGLFIDEVSLVPQRNAFKAILRQGRSKRIPVIACTQRPVDCDREVFTESQYVAVFRMDDERDYKIIKGFTRGAAIDGVLPKYHSHWYDKVNSYLRQLPPAPPPAKIAADLKASAPRRYFFR